MVPMRADTDSEVMAKQVTGVQACRGFIDRRVPTARLNGENDVTAR